VVAEKNKLLLLVIMGANLCSSFRRIIRHRNGIKQCLQRLAVSAYIREVPYTDTWNGQFLLAA